MSRPASAMPIPMGPMSIGAVATADASWPGRLDSSVAAVGSGPTDTADDVVVCVVAGPTDAATEPAVGAALVAPGGLVCGVVGVAPAARRSNVTWVAMESVTVVLHVAPCPTQAPVQPWKIDPEPAAAVKVTACP